MATSSARGSGSSSGATTTAHDNSNPSLRDPAQPSDSGSGSGTGGGSGSCSLYKRIVQFSPPSSVNVSETSGPCTPSSVTLAVYVVNPSPNCPAISVNYATQNGSAMAGTDYTAESNTLGFASGQSSPDYITIPILDDGTDETVGSEYFTVYLYNPVNAILGSPTSITVNVEEGPQQKATDTLRWNPCTNNLASTVTNWYDVTQGFQLQAGAPGLALNPPIQFDANPADTPNSNAPITWDQKATVASISFSQYSGLQTINSGITVESKGTSGTALSMDGGSWLNLDFLDSGGIFQIDNNATITNMVLSGDRDAHFIINNGTTTIAQQSSGTPYTDKIGVQFNINGGATLSDKSYNSLVFGNTNVGINDYGSMLVFYGAGAKNTLMDSGGYSNVGINVIGGTLDYLGNGGVIDTFNNTPILVQSGGTFYVESASNGTPGGKLIVKGTATQTNNVSVYVTGGESSVYLSQSATLECDNGYY